MPPEPTDTSSPAEDTAGADTPPQITQLDDLVLYEAPAVICDAPSLREAQPFTRHVPPGDWQEEPFVASSGSLFVGGGLAIGDFNDDGVLDLFLTAYDARATLFFGSADGTYQHATQNLPDLPERTSGATAVDIDGDGDLDLHITAFRSDDLMLINDGTGVFTDEAVVRGLQGPEHGRTMSSAWVDIDHDGDLDAFVAGYGRLGGGNGLPPGDRSAVLIQQDDGTFVDLVPELVDPHPLLTAHTFMGGFTDVDDDGWHDLFLVNDFGWKFPTLLLHNRDGLLLWEGETGVELVWENMGLGIGDINGDLVPDFFVGAWDHLGLLTSRDGAWFEVSELRGLSPDAERGQHVGWGTELADVDNDGDLDAFAAFGYLPVNSNNINPQQQADALFVQGDDGQFVDMAPAWGLDDTGRGRGFVVTDLNHDGWLDLIKRELRGPTKIYLGTCGEASWLGLHLRQPGPNPYAIGARILVTTSDGVQRRELRAGGTTYGSGGPPQLHVGLADATSIDRLEIRWPDGQTHVLEDVDVNRYITVERQP